MKITYPVIFTDIDTNILIEVPDLGIMTEANAEGSSKATMADAIMTARDAIGLACISAEDADRELTPASDLADVDVTKGIFYEEGKCLLSLVDVDLEVYRKMVDNKMVRRNVTLPNWLNQEADKASINVSKVLQDALIAVLGVTKKY